MKIVIADVLPTSATDVLVNEGWTVDARTGRPLDELIGDVTDADGLIVRSATKVTAELIAAASKLRIIARAGTGVDNVDLHAASARGILVVNAPGANSVSVAEHTCALMLALSRSVALADASMKAGRWNKKSLQGTELRGKTLGLVGLGRIGREVARRARVFEMTVVCHDPFIGEQVAQDIGVELIPLNELCARSDFVSLHLPSTADTVGFVGRQWLAQCKPGVRIINTARGDLIDEEALEEAIGSGQVAGAGLDVFGTEPPTNRALIDRPEVVATPHIAAATREAQELVGVETASCVRDFLASGVVRNAVNFPSISPEEFHRLQPYLALSERLGSLLAQLTPERIDTLGIRYYGELADSNHDMLVGAVLVGLFRNVLSSSVTLVNARTTASQRGLEIIESQSTRPRNFTSLISVKVHTSTGERWAEGAVFAPDEPRLVLLDGVAVEATLEGTVLVIKNTDQPGVIGDVGTVLGRRGINIASFALGRSDTGAVGVVHVEASDADDALGGDILEELQRIPAVDHVQAVHL